MVILTHGHLATNLEVLVHPWVTHRTQENDIHIITVLSQKRIHSQRERHTRQALWGSQTQTSCLVKVHYPSGTLVFKNMDNTAKQEACLNFSVRFLLRLLHRHNWLNHWPCSWTQSLASLLPSWRSGYYHHDSKPQSSNHMVNHWEMISPHPEVILGPTTNQVMSINKYDPSGSWITKTLLPLGKFQRF